jgi:deazaflavin-dependent oxidoreductase (nitroreductase family)
MTDQQPAQKTATGADISLVGPEHLRKYLETDGEVGYIWNGAPILVLTTKGRQSGEVRQIPIIFARDGDDVILIASKGGAPSHPAWYLNLAAEPHVQLQIKAEKFDAVASTVDESPERERLWAEAVKVWPAYDIYQTRTTRKIPVVRLKRVKA